MPSLKQYASLIRQMGPGWLLYRAGYAARRRSGLLRRATPAVNWTELPTTAVELKPRRLAGPTAQSVDAACVAEADAILRGEFRLFSHRVVPAGVTPDWHRNQLTGEQLSAGQHWTKLGDFAFGDIKGVWELSRFSWAFTLARAHAGTGEARYAENFWRLFADWCARNPPNLGPNWMCGQEATFRLMAVVFAAEVCGVPENHRLGLARFVVATGQRIAANLNYALSQKNNHGVSECIGLITAALLAPVHSESAGWLDRGLRHLKRQLDELVYADGGFAQHSLIYHRVLLHDLCWCRNRLDQSGRASPAWLDATAQRALAFLMALVDPSTGLAPLYGTNDGANILPLATTGFLDMRPVVQMAAAVFRQELPMPEGPWDEAAAWLMPGWNALKRVFWPAVPARWHARMAGCFQLTQGTDRLFLRCPEKFRHRPGQADMLHADVWHCGWPVALDGGSFSYNSPERFTALSTAAQHNVLTVDGREPLDKFSRFLYLPWPAGRAGEVPEDRGQRIEGGGSFRASHDGYTKLGVGWTREVAARPGGGFIIRDRVTGAKGHHLVWHWRLADRPWQKISAGNGVETLIDGCNFRIGWQSSIGLQSRLLRADAATAYGWWSPHYAEVEPAYALLLEVQAAGDVELVTEFGPAI